MNIGEKIKELCAERGIAVSKLEKDLGFSNGYIAKLKTNKMRADRLYPLAEYLEVDPDDLMIEGAELQVTKENADAFLDAYHSYYDKKRTAQMAQAFKDNPDLRLLFDAARDSSPEDINTIYQVLLALKRKERR